MFVLWLGLADRHDSIFGGVLLGGAVELRVCMIGGDELLLHHVNTVYEYVAANCLRSYGLE